MAMDTAAFVTVAESWVDTPFKHQGRLPGVGLDCGGLVVCALRAVGVEVGDMRGYGRVPYGGQLQRLVEEHCDRIPTADLAPGDLCLFRFHGDTQHLAIFAGGTPPRLIHCWQEAGRVLAHDFDGTWRARLASCYRVKGLVS